MKRPRFDLPVAPVVTIVLLASACEFWAVEDETPGPIFLDARVNGDS